ncbi:Coiled-Coil Domain-Containing Protein 27 [Manis pentadactyla]|nr:Coiled-Coil Domain-Containing Protein 27 [Manis pentadactyla]
MRGGAASGSPPQQKVKMSHRSYWHRFYGDICDAHCSDTEAWTLKLDFSGLCQAAVTLGSSVSPAHDQEAFERTAPLGQWTLPSAPCVLVLMLPRGACVPKRSTVWCPPRWAEGLMVLQSMAGRHDRPLVESAQQTALPEQVGPGHQPLLQEDGTQGAREGSLTMRTLAGRGAGRRQEVAHTAGPWRPTRGTAGPALLLQRCRVFPTHDQNHFKQRSRPSDTSFVSEAEELRRAFLLRPGCPSSSTRGTSMFSLR